MLGKMYNPYMKVIFIHDIGGKGKRNDIKDVPDGYALNFLIPNGHAVHATPERIKAIQSQVAVAKRAAEDRHKKAIQGLERLKGANIRVLARANPAGGLYREISPDMITAAISSSYGVHIPQQAIVIREPIKKVGQHPVTITDEGHATDIHVTVVKNGN